MASYLDAGSIVAIAAGLALWTDYFHLSNTTIGFLAALGPNAIGAAVGAVIGGRLGDLLGRKRIYQYDLLVYAFGTLWMVFAFHSSMLFIGTVIVGIAVGADVPTSLALVGELAPARARGKLMGLTQVAWSLGPIITLVLALVLSPYGLLGIRIIFAQLFVVSLVTWFLRQGRPEASPCSACGSPLRCSSSCWCSCGSATPGTVDSYGPLAPSARYSRSCFSSSTLSTGRKELISSRRSLTSCSSA
jgi:inositol transporter-like SP family MFS transporter